MEFIIYVAYCCTLIYDIIIYEKSVGQLIQKARDNNINVIFVIGGNESRLIRNNYYNELARHLPGNIHNTSAWSNDSKNIIDIIRDNYRVTLSINTGF